MDEDLRALLAAAAEGDDVAVVEFVRRTEPAVWRLCAALASPGMEEDLVQETYLRAFRSLQTFRGEGSPLRWVLAIARHTCADAVRRRERQRRLLTRLKLEPAAEVPEPQAPVSVWLEGLDRDRREAFVLTQLLGLPYAEAAEVLACPIGTVRSRVARARADLVELVRRSQAN